MKKTKTAKKPLKKKTKKAKKPKAAVKKSKKKYEHHPDHYNTSESYLTENLEEDLQDAWQKMLDWFKKNGAA